MDFKEIVGRLVRKKKINLCNYYFNFLKKAVILVGH